MEGFQGEESVSAYYFRCPAKLKSCAMEFEEAKRAVVHIRTDIFTADIHEHGASPFVGVCSIAIFRTGTHWL